MSQIHSLHNESMDLAEFAVISQMQGDYKRSEELFRKALILETQAAELLRDKVDAEPTRSILYRSAASLALDCNDWKEAEKLIAIGLSGNPPEEIAEELRSLYKNTLFTRDLQIKGIVLQGNDFSFSVAGDGTGDGIAATEEVVDRLQYIKTLTYRTADRKAGQPYRSSGASKAATKYPLYMRASLPGSFTVVMTLGKPFQPIFQSFEEEDPARAIVREILDCIELISKGEVEKLRDHISDPPYFNNFVSLMSKIAPDGEDIRTVRFAAKQANDVRNIALVRRQDEISQIPRMESLLDSSEKSDRQEIKGNLRFADATRPDQAGFIKLIRENNTSLTITVPEGMEDLVASYWFQNVVATVISSGNKYYLENVRKSEDV